MTPWKDRRACPDCNGGLADIKLIDHGHGNKQRDLQYAAGDADFGFFLGLFPTGYPILGVVRGKMCQQCGRIVLYAEPRPEPKLE